jgi:regulator of cell morphogenesis and NO signaling
LLKNNTMNSQEFYTNWLSVYVNKTGSNERESALEIVNKIIEFDKEGLVASMKGFTTVELLDFLKVSHQYYLSKKLPEIEQSLLHITSRYSQTHHMLTSLAFFLNSFKNKLIRHIRKEDELLFAFIDNLIKSQEGKLSELEISALLKQNTLAEFEENHDPVEDELGEFIQMIYKLSDVENLPMLFEVFLNQISIFLERRSQILSARVGCGINSIPKRYEIYH